MKKEYALKIESILRAIDTQRGQGCDGIELDPFGEISMTLIGRISARTLNLFILKYSAIDGQSLSQLESDGFDIRQLINDLEKIKKEFLERI